MSPAASSRGSSCERNTEKNVHEKFTLDSNHLGSGKESWRPAGKHGSVINGSLNASNAYNPLSASFHHLDARAPDSAGTKSSHNLKHFDGQDETSTHRFVQEFDSVSNNSSCSGDSEDQHAGKDRTNASSLPAGASCLDKREKIRLKNEKKHMRQKQRKAQELRDKCISYLTSRKLESLSEQLESMGFAKDRATMALICNDGHLERSITWLLEAGDEELKEDWVGSGALKLDISDELAQITELESRFGIGKPEVERAIVSCEGDITKAINLLREKQPPCVTTPAEPATLGSSPFEPTRAGFSQPVPSSRPPVGFVVPEARTNDVIGPCSSADFPTLQSASKATKQNPNSVLPSRPNPIASPNPSPAMNGYQRTYSNGAVGGGQRQNGNVQQSIQNGVKEIQPSAKSGTTAEARSLTSGSPSRSPLHVSMNASPVRSGIPIPTEKSSSTAPKAWKPVAPVPPIPLPASQTWGKVANSPSVVSSSPPAAVLSVSKQGSTPPKGRNILQEQKSSPPPIAKPRSTQPSPPWTHSTSSPIQSQMSPNVHFIPSSEVRKPINLSQIPSNQRIPNLLPQDSHPKHASHAMIHGEQNPQPDHQARDVMDEISTSMNALKELQFAEEEVPNLHTQTRNFALPVPKPVHPPFTPSFQSTDQIFGWNSWPTSLGWGGVLGLGSGLISSVDWSTGGSDQTSLGGSVNMWGVGTAPGPSMWDSSVGGSSSGQINEPNHHGNGLDKTRMWGMDAGNHHSLNHASPSLGVSITNGGESSEAGMQVWTSPFAGRPLFSLPYQAALPTL